MVVLRRQFCTSACFIAGAYISENLTHYYLPDWAYLGQKSGKNTMKEWSEHKIKPIFELSTLENPYIDSLFGLIYEFKFL